MQQEPTPPDSSAHLAANVPSGRPCRRPLSWLWLGAALALASGLYLLAYKDVLWAPGFISQNWDQTFPPFASQIRIYGDISSAVWSAIHEMGSPSPMVGMTFYFDQIVRHGLAGLGGGLLARWLNLAYVLAGTAGFWLLARRLKLSGPAALVTCLVSQFNPRTYALIVSGHTEGGFAYALTPWAVFLADVAFRSESRRAYLAGCLGAGMVTALACSSAFGVTIAGVLLALYGLAAMATRRSLKPALGLMLIGAVAVTLHLHWILPTASGSGGANAFKYNQSAEDLQAEYVHKYQEYSIPPRQAMIGHTDNFGMGTEYAYPVDAPRDVWWKPSAYALLGLALLGLLCPVGNRNLKVFAALSLLVGFWLLTGAKTMPGAFLYEAILARVKVLFFFMARPTRWLLVYYTALALLAGLGVEAVRRRTFWTSHRWPDRLLAGLVLAVLTVYLWPWWSGQLTRPKNDTTQTMALTPQALRPEEGQFVKAIHDDPGLYRVTVFPTITSPTGAIPAPPGSALTRNYAMLGKDSLVGPSFMGQSYGTFLLSLAHRRAVSTDAYGRLLGLGAVGRVLWDREEPYLSYMDFGWMPQTKRGSETLSDPRAVLTPFLAAQRDLTENPAWSFGPFVALDNSDALARVRTVGRAALAAGGFPLLVSMASGEEDIAARTALLFATDMDARGLEGLGKLRQGLFVHNDAWPELLLPFLPDGCWHPACQGTGAAGSPPQGWSTLTERWHQALWFSGSPLNGLALWSQARADLSIPLSGSGPHRVFVRAASLPGQHGLDIRLGGKLLAATPSADPFDRGWRWLDLGVVRLEDGQPLLVAARGRGAVVAGALAVPEAQFLAARAGLDALFPPKSDGADATILAEAEACVEQSAGPYALVRDIPLLADMPGVALATDGLVRRDMDGSGLGLLAAEGESPGQALFQVDFPQPVSGFTLVTYPRLFGDPHGLAYAQAEWSADGKDFHPLYRLIGSTDDKWEHVYERRTETAVTVRTTRLWLRFSLRQAQLASLGNSPNQPMMLSISPAEPFPGAPSMGQAVLLPAAFAPKTFRTGPHQVRARLLTPQGPRWEDVGVYEPDAQGVFHLALDASGHPATAVPGQADALACDLLEITSLPHSKEAPAPPALSTTRQGPTHYTSQGEFPAEGLLVFSESFHPGWQALADGHSLPHLKAFGSMNAYVLPQVPPAQIQLDFAPEHLRDLGMAVVITAWIVFSVTLAGLLLWPLSRRLFPRSGPPDSTKAARR